MLRGIRRDHGTCELAQRHRPLGLGLEVRHRRPQQCASCVHRLLDHAVGDLCHVEVFGAQCSLHAGGVALLACGPLGQRAHRRVQRFPSVGVALPVGHVGELDHCTAVVLELLLGLGFGRFVLCRVDDILDGGRAHLLEVRELNAGGSAHLTRPVGHRLFFTLDLGVGHGLDDVVERVGSLLAPYLDERVAELRDDLGLDPLLELDSVGLDLLVDLLAGVPGINGRACLNCTGVAVKRVDQAVGGLLDHLVDHHVALAEFGVGLAQTVLDALLEFCFLGRAVLAFVVLFGDLFVQRSQGLKLLDGQAAGCAHRAHRRLHVDTLLAQEHCFDCARVGPLLDNLGGVGSVDHVVPCLARQPAIVELLGGCAHEVDQCLCILALDLGPLGLGEAHGVGVGTEHALLLGVDQALASDQRDLTEPVDSTRVLRDHANRRHSKAAHLVGKDQIFGRQVVHRHQAGLLGGLVELF